jgi:Domain of Unknown Function (DUF748)
VRRSLLVGAAIVLAAVGVYAAAGLWLAPHLVAQALQARAAALGITLTLGEVRTNPFKLTVAFTDVDLVGPDGNRLAAAPRLQVDLAWASLWQDGWIAQRVWVDSPYLEVVLDEGGLNWPAPRAGKNGEAGAPAAVRVHELVLENGTLRFLDRSRAASAEAMLEGVRLEIGNLSTHEGEGQYRLQGRLAPGGLLDSSGTFSLSPAAAHGKLTLSDASLATAWRLALPSSEPGEGRVTLLTAYAYEEGRVVLHDLQARAKSVSYAGMGIESVALAVPRLAIPPAQPVQVSVQAELAPGGKLAARGSVHPRSLAADLAVEAEGLPLPLAQRFLPESTALRLAAGELSAKGRLQAEERRIAFEGSAEVADLRVEERDSRRLLLGWELARTQQVAVSAAPVAIEVGELVVRAPEGRIVIERDGSVNFAEVVPGGGEKQDKGGAPLRASVRRLALENGTLHFADRSLETPFEVTMGELTGTVTGLRTAAGDPARLQIEGRVGEYGSVRIRGTTDLDQPKSLANVTARFENVSLAQLTPYVAKFAGYRVRSGRVSAELRYRVRDARLVGENRFVFQELELGEKVERAGAPDLPLELAVALLADAKGRITLDIPVRGNLNDPQFDFGGLIARALGNVIGKLVSAPFRALAGLFGANGQALDEVRFEPGSAALSPPQEENIAKVAQALAERPQLGVTVHGSYDPERDAAALRRAAARRDIAQRAGYESDGPLDFTDPRTLRAAEALYLERIGKRADLQALRANEPRYGRALLELLAYTLPQDRGDPQALARERAQAVRAALAERGVDPGRVALEPPTANEAAESGVPTQLSLTPHAAGAAAGATR